MSFPVYEAIGFQNILEKGGHSKPWVVTVYSTPHLSGLWVSRGRNADPDVEQGCFYDLNDFRVLFPTTGIIDEPHFQEKALEYTAGITRSAYFSGTLVGRMLPFPRRIVLLSLF